MDKVYVTAEGLEKLEADLAHCMSERRRVADVIEYARSFGDLKENAEYHAAKENQAMLQAQIRNFEDKIARAAIIEDQDIDGSKAYVGATVKVLNKKTSKEFTYMLVSEIEADLASGKISVRSPVGKAFLGLSVGDIAVAKVPAGNIEFEILDINR